MSKMGRRKESSSLINGYLKQNNRRGQVVVQHFCMVKISHAQPAYTGLSSGAKSSDKWERKQIED